jgi:hypothetical protein
MRPQRKARSGAANRSSSARRWDHADIPMHPDLKPGLRSRFVTVTVEAEVIAVEGRTVRFHARAFDDRDLISEGTHERVVIDNERFLRKVAEKARAAGS